MLKELSYRTELLFRGDSIADNGNPIYVLYLCNLALAVHIDLLVVRIMRIFDIPSSLLLSALVHGVNTLSAIEILLVVLPISYVKTPLRT